VEALGLPFILLSIPLMLRWVPPNRFFGLRIPATRKESVWYDANALNGRHLFLLGVAMVVVEFLLPWTPWSAATRRGILWTISTTGFLTIVVADWRTANRWSRERP
jgi:hypothetical protein